MQFFFGIFFAPHSGIGAPLENPGSATADVKKSKTEQSLIPQKEPMSTKGLKKKLIKLSFTLTGSVFFLMLS